jgi:hypothetical protein
LKECDAVSVFHAGAMITGYSPTGTDERNSFRLKLSHGFQGSHPVPTGLNQYIQHFTFTIHRAPQIHMLTIDQNKHFVEMPAGAGSRSTSSEPAGICCFKLQHPAPDGLVLHVDPTLGEKILDIPNAQREPEIQQNCMLDNFRREAVSAI